MVIILDNVISNFDLIKKDIILSLKDKNLSIDWCAFDHEHQFQDLCELA